MIILQLGDNYVLLKACIIILAYVHMNGENA